MSEAPDFEHAIVDQTKVVNYLLGTSVPASIAKSRFFGLLGFSAAGWQELARCLRTQAHGATVTSIATPWGRKHVATGNIDAPNGGRYKIVSVWIEEGDRLRLVTAYPAKG